MPETRKRLTSGDAAPASKKRKTDKDLQKYYAVRAGVRPGVYLTWPECQKQISGFRGAQYKSFLSRDDANAFVAGKNPATSNSGPTPPKFYAVARGVFTGIFPDWETASLAIKGVKGPKYKKFETREDAVGFIEEYGDEDTIAKVKAGKETVDGGSSTTTTPAAAAAVPAPATATKKKTTKANKEELNVVSTDMMAIYTDGSSLANGRKGACAGVGVYFGANDSRNVSERLKGEPQTNQRAELTAILRALQIMPLDQNVQIFTDSQYSINCVTEWYKNWAKRDWHTSTGEPVKNKDLVQAVRERIEARDEELSQTVFTWVKGHSTNAGNVAADQLAVAGARLTR